MNRRNERAITLIALVVTIVVLLILAGVSIAMLTGENGIISQAKRAKEETQKAEEEEMESINGRIYMGGYWYDSMEDYVNGVVSKNQGDIEKKVSKYKELKIFAETETILEDDEKNTVVLPAEFKIAEDSATVVNDGVVIEDEEGNQYVWVPVTKDAEGGNTAPYAETGTLADGTEIKLSRYAFDINGIEIDKGEDVIDNFHYLNTPGISTPNWETMELESYAEQAGVTSANNIEEFKESVAENGGYYIARYEAGVEIKLIEVPSTSGSETQVTKKAVTVSKKGADIYNRITQPNASLKCQNLYLNVKSDLINSYAWDTAIVYIQKCSDGENSSGSQSGSGNGTNLKYSRATSKNQQLSSTGVNGDEVCKINDLAGNLGEWTTEMAWWNISWQGTSQGAVVRGGRFSGTEYFTSFRGHTGYIILPTDTLDDVGFRAILYL